MQEKLSNHAASDIGFLRAIDDKHGLYIIESKNGTETLAKFIVLQI